MNKILVFLVCLCWFGTDLKAQDECSLVVQIVNSEGVKVRARVAVEERDGRRIEKVSPIPEDIRFCDLGIFPVTVTVGHQACYQVIVRGVTLELGKTRTLKVIHEGEPCVHADWIRIGSDCGVLLRFVNSEHNYVKGVSLAIRAPRQETRQADPFGRLYTGVPLNQELVGTASANGYDPVEVKVPCSKPQNEFEQYVVMHESR